MIRTARLIKHNWHRNHRHHGGLGAVARCLMGTLAVRSGLASHRWAKTAAVEMLTFSVVPWMTALWARLLSHALSDLDAEILIGDCSGGLGQTHRRLMAGGRIRVLPYLNAHHGEKIDFFLARLCRAPYVVIVDDDVFWLSGEPLAWALAQLDADRRLAAVSLLPRRVVSGALEKDGISQPMGSHCLVIRRALWRRERLSFAIAPPPEGVDDWFYDTGDSANRELLRRGYRVKIAPPELERCFAAFDGVSSWVLKLQGHSPERLSATIAGISVRQRKALQTVWIVRGLAAILAELRPTQPTPEIIAEARLAAAERVVEGHLPAAARDAIRRTVEKDLSRLQDRLMATESAPRG